MIPMLFRVPAIQALFPSASNFANGVQRADNSGIVPLGFTHRQAPLEVFQRLRIVTLYVINTSDVVQRAGNSSHVANLFRYALRQTIDSDCMIKLASKIQTVTLFDHGLNQLSR